MHCISLDPIVDASIFGIPLTCQCRTGRIIRCEDELVIIGCHDQVISENSSDRLWSKVWFHTTRDFVIAIPSAGGKSALAHSPLGRKLGLIDIDDLFTPLESQELDRLRPEAMAYDDWGEYNSFFNAVVKDKYNGGPILTHGGSLGLLTALGVSHWDALVPSDQLHQTAMTSRDMLTEEQQAVSLKNKAHILKAREYYVKEMSSLDPDPTYVYHSFEELAQRVSYLCWDNRARSYLMSYVDTPHGPEYLRGDTQVICEGRRPQKLRFHVSERMADFSPYRYAQIILTHIAKRGIPSGYGVPPPVFRAHELMKPGSSLGDINLLRATFVADPRPVLCFDLSGVLTPPNDHSTLFPWVLDMMAMLRSRFHLVIWTSAVVNLAEFPPYVRVLTRNHCVARSGGLATSKGANMHGLEVYAFDDTADKWTQFGIHPVQAFRYDEDMPKEISRYFRLENGMYDSE